jgi:hypothetical protein
MNCRTAAVASNLVKLAGLLCFFPGAALKAQATSPATVAGAVTPAVDVWMDTDFYENRRAAEAFFNAAAGSYVVVVRVATNHTLEVLYPSSPASQAPYKPSAEARTRVAFTTDGAFGLGLIYAISSDRPFDFSKVSDGTNWNADRLKNPRGVEGDGLAGAFFEDVAVPGALVSVAQTAFVNGAVTYLVGAHGYATDMSSTNAAGVSRAAIGAALGTDRRPSAYDALQAALQRCRGLANSPLPMESGCSDLGLIYTRDPKVVTPRPPAPPPPPPPPARTRDAQGHS